MALDGQKERLWLPLGYGGAAKYGIGPKAALLDVARRYRLPAANRHHLGG